MVVFGAGASYDSDPNAVPADFHSEYRPPLAASLFEKRNVFREAREYPRIQEVLPGLRAAGPGVEAALSRLSDEAGQNPRRLEQLAAVRYYIRSAIWACERQWAHLTEAATSYLALLDRIQNADPSSAKVWLVTFNYDTLLERALEHFVGASLPSQESFSFGRFELVKLHGSTNWYREVLNPAISTNRFETADRCIKRATELRLGDFRFHPKEVEPTDASGGQIPAIAVPLAEKTAFECPPRHIERLREALPRVSRILIVGWAGNDRHFSAELAGKIRPGTRVGVVNGAADAADTTERLLKDTGLSEALYVPVVGGFSQVVRDGRADGLLAPPVRAME